MIKSKSRLTKARLGLIPADWKTAFAKDICFLITNGFVGKATPFYTEKDGVLYIQGYNVVENSFNFNGIKRVTYEFHKKNSKSTLRKWDLLTIQTGDVGLTTIVPQELEGSNCHALIISRFNQEIAFPPFYSQYYNSYLGRRRLRRIETGSTMKHINVSDLKKFILPLPPLPEQKKIATILSTWDQAIEKLGQLIAAKEEQKKGLMQRLLTGKVRLPGFEEDWEEVTLGKFLVKHNEKTDVSNQYPVLTSSRKGIFLQKDYFSGRNVASTDTTGYNVVPKGYFTYRHMSDDFDFKFNINSIVEKGIVSTLYPVFTTKKINKDFMLLKLNEGEEFKRYARKQKQGGSRTYMYFSKLSKLKVLIPSLQEQNQIVKTINCSSREIMILRSKRKAIKEQKKGLMQQLLTGKTRVKV